MHIWNFSFLFLLHVELWEKFLRIPEIGSMPDGLFSLSIPISPSASWALVNHNKKIKKGENAEVLTEIFHRRGAQIPRKWKILCNLWFAIFYPPRRFGKKKSIACKCCAFAALEPIFCLSVNVSDSKRFDKWKPISMEISTGWEKCSSRDFSLHHPASFIITIHATTEWYGR